MYSVYSVPSLLFHSVVQINCFFLTKDKVMASIIKPVLTANIQTLIEAKV